MITIMSSLALPTTVIRSVECFLRRSRMQSGSGSNSCFSAHLIQEQHFRSFYILTVNTSGETFMFLDYEG